MRDMVRVTHARMSGGYLGIVVLHVAPEAAVGGPLAAVENGDTIVLDVKRRRIDLKLTSSQIQKRLTEWKPPQPRYRRGYPALSTVSEEQANRGCDFRFM